MSRPVTDFEVIDACRSCGEPELSPVLDLGELPLADALVRSGASREDEARYPLTLVWCPACSLLQILETVDPTTLYATEYPYYSSFSPALVEHARKNVHAIIERTHVDEESLVVELASNDGYLLQWFHKEGIPVLGIDPAKGPAEVAVEKGIPTICDFFTEELAESLVAEGSTADVIVGNNVLAHVPDQNAFVAAIATLLKPDGLVVMEFPYARDFIEKSEFDTIYHEHHCYFSVHSVQNLFARHGLKVVRVEHHGIHGGSLRVFFSRTDDVEASVGVFLGEEASAGMLGAGYYREFSEAAATVKSELLALLHDLRSDGRRIAAYAAAAKGAVLLNFCGVEPALIDYVVDRNHHKHGWEMPGVPIPVRAPEVLREDPPDYLLVLAWNFKDEILEQQAWFGEQGGKFIIPIPRPTVL